MSDTTVLPPENKIDPSKASNLQHAKNLVELRAKYLEAKHKVSMMALESIIKYPSYFDGISSILAAKINDVLAELRADPKNIKKLSIRDAKDLSVAMESAQRGKYAAMRVENILASMSQQFEEPTTEDGIKLAGPVGQAPLQIIVKGSPEELKARYDQKTD